MAISPIILNVVVDAVVHHLVTVMVEVAEERGGKRQEGRHHNSLFHADDGMVALLNQQWLQGDFSTLVGLFDRVNLRTNVKKIVGMICHPCQATGTQSENAYGRRMMGEGPSYQERQMGRVQCKECGEEMALGFPAGHMQTNYGREVEGRQSWEGEKPQTYSMAFPTAGGMQN